MKVRLAVELEEEQRPFPMIVMVETLRGVQEVTIPLGIGYYITDLERIWRRNLHRFGNHQHVLRAMARALLPPRGPSSLRLHSFDNRLHVQHVQRVMQ